MAFFDIFIIFGQINCKHYYYITRERNLSQILPPLFLMVVIATICIKVTP